PTTGIATSLVRMSPGTALPVHQHIGVEHVYVIEGDCTVAGQRLTSGDYQRAETGSIHETTSTVGGTLLLLIAPERAKCWTRARRRIRLAPGTRYKPQNRGNIR